MECGLRSRVNETVDRPSVRPSVCPSHHSTAAGFLPSAVRAGDIDRQGGGGHPAAAALSSKCEQCHVEQSCLKKLKTNLAMQILL